MTLDEYNRCWHLGYYEYNHLQIPVAPAEMSPPQKRAWHNGYRDAELDREDGQ